MAIPANMALTLSNAAEQALKVSPKAAEGTLEFSRAARPIVDVTPDAAGVFRSTVNNAAGVEVLKPSTTSWRESFARFPGSKKVLVAAVASGLTAVGATFGVDALIDALDAQGYKDEAEAVRALSEVSRRLRQRVTGDGSEDTVMGESLDAFHKNAAIEDEQFALIDTGVRVLGSVNAFKALREAVFGVEDVFLERYQQLYPRGRRA